MSQMFGYGGGQDSDSVDWGGFSIAPPRINVTWRRECIVCDSEIDISQDHAAEQVDKGGSWYYCHPTCSFGGYQRRKVSGVELG